LLSRAQMREGIFSLLSRPKNGIGDERCEGSVLE
jgi:hypothetical protein